MNARAKAAYLEQIKEAGARSARVIECPRCRAIVLRGDDHDRVSMTVSVDPEPVDLLTEMFALIDGRHSYDLVKATGKFARAGRYDLHRREPWHVSSTKHPYPIHLEHRCERRQDDVRLSTLW